VNGPEVVRLTPGQRNYARWVAERRQGTAPPWQAHGCNGGLAEHLTGAEGECAFAIWCNPARPRRLAIGTYRSEADYPPVTEIRTRTAAHWDLIVRPIDRPDYAYVLAVPFGSDPGAWRLAGWTWGAVARQDRWWSEIGDRVPAWFVPQGALLPMRLWRAMIPAP
jgi:hypothetical protein